MLVGGCGASAWTIAHHVSVATAGATLACDWGGTRASADRGWGVHRDEHGQLRRRYESNPLLGPEPSPSKVDVYFLGSAVLAALAWYAMPKRYRIAVPLLVAAISTKATINNVIHDVGVCGYAASENTR